MQDTEQTKIGPFIRITEEAEGATVKTEAGIRRVPVHSELLRLGFMEYVEDMRQAGAVAFWPAYKPRVGKPGGYFSDGINPFHKEAARNQGALPVPRTASNGTGRPALGQRGPRDHRSSHRHDTGLSAAELTYTHVSDVDLKVAIETLGYSTVKLGTVYTRG